MEKKEIAKINLLENGEVHILLCNSKTVYCTNKSMFALFTSPYNFIQYGYQNYEESTRYVNNPRIAFTDIQGLTMAVVYDDSSIEIIFPILFEQIVALLDNSDSKRLNFKEYRYKKEFRDQKSFLMRLFLEFAEYGSGAVIEKKIPISVQAQERILREIINNSMENVTKIEQTASSLMLPEQQSDVPEKILDSLPKKNMVPISQYAKKHGLVKPTLVAWIRTNKLATAEKIGNRFYVDINEPIPEDRRKGRKAKGYPDGRKVIRLKSKNYEDVQTYIQERKLVTDAIRPYIRTYDEIKYYEKNSYHEVFWNGVSALIIDVNVDYFSKQLNKSNRELMLEGKPPVVPGSDTTSEHEKLVPRFHLHHIGQTPNSPFAIIPETIHNGKEMYKIFHQGSSTEELHTPEFEAEKKLFWKTYIKIHDEYFSYRNIPYLNSKHSKDKR